GACSSSGESAAMADAAMKLNAAQRIVQRFIISCRAHCRRTHLRRDNSSRTTPPLVKSLSYGFFAPGPPSSLLPANTFLPSGNTHVRALTVLEPSFARKPSMEMESPIFIVSFLQP